MSPFTAISPDAPHAAAIGRAHGIRRTRVAGQRNRPSPALAGAIAAADARLAAAPDPLAYLPPERFAANRQSGRGDTLGVGPRLAPR
ncbi:MAG TPA: hypothetical protein VFH27_11955 [Longimicrobiaceae bacterium]|nr:hypothetical protein [Longimicrobiaceae bacterium]